MSAGGNQALTPNESMVEEASLGLFKKLGYAVRNGPPRASGEPTAGFEALRDGCWRGDGARHPAAESCPAQQPDGTKRRCARLSCRIRRTKSRSSNDAIDAQLRQLAWCRASAKSSPLRTPATACSRAGRSSAVRPGWASRWSNTCRIRSDRGRPAAGVPWPHRLRPPPRSSGPAHWCPRQSRAQQARRIEVRRHGWPAGLQQSEPALRHWLLRLPGAQLDVIPHQRERHAAAPAQPELLPQRLGDGYLPFAGDRAGDGIGRVHRNALPEQGITW